VIYYYTELYNLDYNEEKPGDYRLLSYITDLDGNIIKEYPEKVITKPGPSAVLVGGHNLITLPSSTYIFKISVEDLESKETIESFKRFTFLKPTDKKIAIADTIYQNNTEKINLEEYIELSDQELDQEFNKIRYLTSNRDSKIFQNLDSQSKKIFLAQFWKRLDNNPNTEVNEFKVYYNSMIEYANANFGTMNRQGLETDRGRILLTYGTPNEIERNYMVINQKPHEIWHYDELEGGSLFIFADITGFGEFDLIHSTYSRELYQPDWERLINKTQSSFDTETP
jgi:GWxTD domain-containing protein